MKLVKIASSVIAAAMLLTACNNSVDFKKTKGGVAYKLFPGKTSKDTISPENVIKYNVIRRVVGNGKDTIIQNTYGTMPQFEDVRLSTGTYFDAFSEILLKAHPGDSIYFEQSIDSFIAKQPDIVQSTPFRNGDKLISSLRILSVYKTREIAQAEYLKERGANSVKLEEQELKTFNASPEVKTQMAIDNKIIEDYIKANNIQTQKSPWGAFVQVIDAGTGPKPSFGKYLQIKYRGTNLEGKEFDAGVFPLQFGAGGSIKGFEEGVRFLGKGGKSKVLVPSMLAYGPRGQEPKIKPNEVLMFDMEVLDISDTPPAQPQMPIPMQDSASTKGNKK